jgi:hypothetical protein
MPMPSPGAAVEIFYSYAHEDEALRGQLEKHLSVLSQRDVIRAWHDRKIGAGEKWEKQISEHLESARLILLLVSADFLASPYCFGVELKRAMQRHDAGEALVIPIILRPVDWTGAPFSELQALPTDAKPVTSWSNMDEAFLDIAKGIRAAVEGLVSFQQPSEKASRGQFVWNARPKVPDILPYLCDRSDQERELSIALREHQEVRPRRPFICIIHGHCRECHSEFLERMQQTAMTNVLNLKARQLSIEEYRLHWPSRIKASEGSERVFRSALGESLLGNSAASKAEILEFISQHERPLLITSRLLTEDFVAGDTESLSVFLDFWNGWFDLPPGRTLINCICLKYQDPSGMFLIRKWKMRRTNEQLRSFIGQLDYAAYRGLHGVTLPELKAIRHADVLAWIHSKSVKEFCNIRERDISSLFARAELCTDDGHISMEMLADELNALIHNSRH